ncbi:hypothetical protein BS47DRAFT_806131 [Hydnum rufescens UP504]|uniref:Uncharacterized protein n=1 Tax=Hydnum rufescens UP504 TaxID=1448309 RepID=A0A9P6DUE6_9AGAM|nr:hypothetical protein BS47DRAFT_806131 [Hydnum rufescens UP504]
MSLNSSSHTIPGCGVLDNNAVMGGLSIAGELQESSKKPCSIFIILHFIKCPVLSALSVILVYRCLIQVAQPNALQETEIMRTRWFDPNLEACKYPNAISISIYPSFSHLLKCEGQANSAQILLHECSSFSIATSPIWTIPLCTV